MAAIGMCCRGMAAAGGKTAVGEMTGKEKKADSCEGQIAVYSDIPSLKTEFPVHTVQ